MTRFISIILFVFSLSSCALEPHQDTLDFIKLYQIEANFDEVRDELVNVIEEEGLVISFISHAAKMLERTASSVEEKGNIYGNAEVLLFCKANLSHQLSLSEPHSLILCPHAIAVYTLKSNENIVYMSIRKSPENLEAYQGVFKLLESLILQVIEEIG